MPEPRCVECGNRVPWISFWGNIAATVYKVTVGVLGGSSALVADGLHSFTDVIGTSAILVSRGVAGRPADDTHPYGHGKVEFMGSAFIYTVLFFLSISIFAGGVLMILEGDTDSPKLVTVLAAGVSVFYNVLMYLMGQCAGRCNNSPALLANSFENRADAISSVACIVGILLAMYVHPIFDPIAAMAVGVVIFVNCLEQMKEALSGLMDKALPPEVIERIEEVVLSQEGVSGVEFIKTRPTGTKFWVDVGIRVPGDLDVKASDAVARAVRALLMSKSERFQTVEVFVAPEPSEG
ncbi:MAG: cation diffusion facilitator family transporter [Deferrisomatales bacterium]